MGVTGLLSCVLSPKPQQDSFMGSWPLLPATLPWPGLRSGSRPPSHIQQRWRACVLGLRLLDEDQLRSLMALVSPLWNLQT